jgi:hypothetical protein
MDNIVDEVLRGKRISRQKGFVVNEAGVELEKQGS